MIRPEVVGFTVYNASGKKVGKVASFAEAVELNETHDPPAPPGPPVDAVDTAYCRHVDPYSKTWESRAIGIPVVQIEKFNADAKRHGTGVTYLPDPRNPNFAIATADSARSRTAELRRRGLFCKLTGQTENGG